MALKANRLLMAVKPKIIKFTASKVGNSCKSVMEFMVKEVTSKK
jgi:hypothetical protein